MKLVFKLRNILLVFSALFFLFSFQQAFSEGTDPCTEQMALDAEEAASGMNLESIMLIGQATSTAVTPALKGNQAKAMYRANGGLQSTLSAIALKRYALCESKISVCEESCSPENCQQIAGAKATGHKQPDPICAPTLAKCEAQQATCNQAGWQALLSGIAGLSSLATANMLGDEDGDGNAGNPTPTNLTPGDLPPMDPADVTNSDEYGSRDQVRDFNDDNGNPDGDTENKGTKVVDSEDFNPGDEWEESSSGARGGGGASSLASNAFGSRGEADNNEDEEEEEEIVEEYSSGSLASFAGSKNNAYARAPFDVEKNSGASSSKKNGLRGGRKLASNKKSDLALKGLPKGGHSRSDSIFMKMSKLIQSYCTDGKKNCY